MKIALLVCVLTATVHAAPPYKRKTTLDPALGEQVRLAEQAWTAAEREPDPANQQALWEQAADAFARIDAAPVAAQVKRDAAHAAVLAWRNALGIEPREMVRTTKLLDGKPREIPARALKLFAAIDRYATYATPSDPELPALLFIKAATYAELQHYETAIPIFRAVVDNHRNHDVAEYAASLLLDCYNRLKHFDQLLAVADELGADAAFMRAHPDLAATVHALQRQARRRHAERLEMRAKESHEFAAYTECGRVYLGLFKEAPKASDGDELLYNAGVCFELGRELDAAIQAFTLMQSQYPHSKITARALARLGKLYGDIAEYAKAAETLETYAMKYAGEKDAYDAMSDAVFYRRAIGDRDKAIRATKLFIKAFGSKRPEQAANAHWELAAFYEHDRDKLIKHLHEYVRVHGAKGGQERLVIAHAKIGQLLWAMSCPHAGIAGLCVKQTKPVARTCGQGTARTFTVTPRNEKRVKDALLAFAQAAKEYAHWESTPKPTPATGCRWSCGMPTYVGPEELAQRAAAERAELAAKAEVRHYFAIGKLVEADLELEKHLAVAFPRGLDFGADRPSARLKSRKRFDDWLEQTQKTGANANSNYEPVLSIQAPATSIAAASRIGMISDSVGAQLVTADIAHDVRTGRRADSRKAYCEAIRDVAAAQEANALQGYGVCLAKSTELGWFDDSSRHCEAQLLRLAPERYPRQAEVAAKPRFGAPVIASEPPLWRVTAR